VARANCASRCCFMGNNLPSALYGCSGQWVFGYSIAEHQTLPLLPWAVGRPSCLDCWSFGPLPDVIGRRAPNPRPGDLVRMATSFVRKRPDGNGFGCSPRGGVAQGPGQGLCGLSAAWPGPPVDLIASAGLVPRNQVRKRPAVCLALKRPWGAMTGGWRFRSAAWAGILGPVRSWRPRKLGPSFVLWPSSRSLFVAAA